MPLASATSAAIASLRSPCLRRLRRRLLHHTQHPIPSRRHSASTVQVAEATKNFSGAELEGLINSATSFALERAMKAHGGEASELGGGDGEVRVQMQVRRSLTHPSPAARVDSVVRERTWWGVYGRWKRPCLQTAHMAILREDPGGAHSLPRVAHPRSSPPRWRLD
jgi:hypothetical protein